MKFIEANGQSAIVSTRTLAMVHGAVYVALNAINRKYDAYYFEGPADSAASPDAAAAHTAAGRPRADPHLPREAPRPVTNAAPVTHP